jgi:hypothetical protein
LVFTTTAQTLTAGVTSGTITVQLDDAFNNTATASGTQTLLLSTSSAAGQFRDNATGNSQITFVTIASGASSASFKYNDTLAGSPVLTVTDNALTNPTATQTETVNAAAASKLVFTTTAQTLTAGVTSGTITVQLDDAFNNIATAASPQIINLTTTSTGGVFRDTGDTTTITSVSIASGSGSASFKYKDTLAGSPVLTVTDSALTNPTATQTETVNAAAASKLVFTTTAQTLTAGVTSGTITIQLDDAFNNTATAASTQTINLSTTSTGGVFRDTGDTTTITSVSIASGASSASFKYKDTLAGSPVLTVTDSALTNPSATQTETVNAAAASKLVFTTTAQTLTAGVTSGTITVQLDDAFNNTATASGTQTINLSTTSTGGVFRDTGDTTTITSVSIASGASSASFKYKDTLAGSPLLTVTDNALSNPTATQTETVNTAAASKLGFVVQPGNTAGGSVINPAVKVAVEDQFGNVLTTDQTDVVTVGVATGPGAFTGSSTTTMMVVNGVATFSNLALTKAGTYTLSESATGGLSGPASSSFNVTLTVTSLVATPTGFTATFSDAFNPADVNLTGPAATNGAASVTLVGSGNIGNVSGSLYLDPTDTKLTFVQTVIVGTNGLPINAGTLPLGTYTLTLFSLSGSPASGFTTTGGQVLDGNSDGTAGDNYTTTFHVVSSNPATGDVLLPTSAVLATVPDFARGPNTPNLTIASTNGATESGNTVTITTNAGHGFTVGQTVVISGVTLSGYNGTFTITSVPTSNSFTYTDLAISNATPSGQGTANVPNVNVVNNSANGIPIDLTVLAPVQTVTFSSPISTGTTGTFKLGFNSQTTAAITVGTTIKAQTASASTSGASESGTTVTIRTSAVHGLKVGQSVTINGVGVGGYNGTFTVTGVPTTTSFTYTAASGLGLSGGGTWNLNGSAALATAIQNALTALSVVGAGNVSVTGTGPFTVTFGAAVANPNLITVASNAISSAPTITVVNLNAPANVTDAVLVLGYNANLLTITVGTFNAGPPGATFTVTTSGSGANAQATITFHSGAGVNLGTLGSVNLGGLVATVPSTAPYQSKGLLHFVSESINGGALTAAGVDGYQVVAYQADTDGTGTYTGNDATLLGQVAAGSSPGFAAYRLVDPAIIGAIAGGTTVSATDSALLASYLNGVAVTQVPNQTGVTPSSFAPGPDPTLSIPTGLEVGTDGTVIVPVNIDDPRPTGSTGLTQALLALTYDTTVFSVTPADVHLGTVPAAGSGWSLLAVVDAVTGELAITLVSQTPIATAVGGSLVTIDFHQLGAAGTGTSPINLVASVDLQGQGMFSTELFDSNYRFTLDPAPTNGPAGTGIAGQVLLQGADPIPAGSAQSAGSDRNESVREETSRTIVADEASGTQNITIIGTTLTAEGLTEGAPLAAPTNAVGPDGTTALVPAYVAASQAMVRPGEAQPLVSLATGATASLLSQYGNALVIDTLTGWNNPHEQASDQVFAAMSRARIDLGDAAFRSGPLADTVAPLPLSRTPRLRTGQDNLAGRLWEDAGDPDRLPGGDSAEVPAAVTEPNEASTEQSGAAQAEE